MIIYNHYENCKEKVKCEFCNSLFYTDKENLRCPNCGHLIMKSRCSSFLVIFKVFGQSPKGIKMSRTSVNNNANRVPSPVKYYISFTGEGQFSYWDGDAKVRKSLGESIDFVVMDTRSAVGGFSEPHNAKIYSNRVQSVTKEELNVRCGKETLVKGFWGEIKDRAKAVGAKFCTEVFALVNVNGVFEPAQIDFMGSSLGDWMSFMDEIGGKWAMYQSVVTATKGDQRKKGKTIYYAVNFSTSDLPEEVAEQANTFNDDKLQPYLTAGDPVAVTA
jgi:hypothetical protein